MAGVNVTKLKGLIVLVPPLPEQNKFMKAAHLICSTAKAACRWVEGFKRFV